MMLRRNPYLFLLLLPLLLIGLLTTHHLPAPAWASSETQRLDAQIQGAVTLSPLGAIGGAIRGLQVADDFAYAGEGRNLVVLNIANPAAPVVLNRTYLPSDIIDVRLATAHLYVTTQSTGLYIFEISTSPLLQRIGYYSLPSAGEMVLDGNYAYVVSGKGFVVFDTAAPDSIQEISRYDVPLERGYSGGITLSGKQIYFTYTTYESNFTNFQGALYIVDVSLPTNPSLSGSYMMAATSSADDVEVVGTTAYILRDDRTAQRGLYTVDISDPANPQPLSQYLAWFAEFTLVGNTAYLTGNQKLVLLDITDPTSLTKISDYSLEDWGTVISTAEKTVYVGSFNSKIHIVDLTNPNLPDRKGLYESVISAQDVFVSDDIAYVAGRWRGGLKLVDISTPDQPQLISHLPLDGDLYRIQVVNKVAYVADAEGRAFWTINVADPANPTVLKRTSLDGYNNDVAVMDTTAYVVNSQSGLHIYDVSDPALPTIVSSYHEKNQSIYSIYVVDDIAYLGDLSGKLIVVDVNNRSEPKKLAEFALNLPARRVFVANEIAYVAMYSGNNASVQLFDVTNPAVPSELGVYETDQPIEDIIVADGLAFAVTASFSQNQLIVLDVSDPSAPTEVITFPKGGGGLFRKDSTLYLAGDSLTLINYWQEAGRIYLPNLSR